MTWIGSDSFSNTCHDCHIIVVDAVVIDRRLEKLGVFFKPDMVLVHKLDILSTACHFGMFNGLESILVKVVFE